MNRTIVTIDWSETGHAAAPKRVGREGRADGGVEGDEVVDVGGRLGPVPPNRVDRRLEQRRDAR